MNEKKRSAIYYAKNRESILEQKKEKYAAEHPRKEKKDTTREVQCICGATMHRSSIYKHYNSWAHRDKVGTQKGYTFINR